jgi:hypothetical protein
MKPILSAATALFALSVLLPAQSRKAESFPTGVGAVQITPVLHASLVIQAGNKVIYVDPAKPATFDGLPPADLILLTDIQSQQSRDRNLGSRRRR